MFHLKLLVMFAMCVTVKRAEKRMHFRNPVMNLRKNDSEMTPIVLSVVSTQIFRKKFFFSKVSL